MLGLVAIYVEETIYVNHAIYLITNSGSIHRIVHHLAIHKLLKAYNFPIF